jgi:hypothetical protein
LASTEWPHLPGALPQRSCYPSRVSDAQPLPPRHLAPSTAEREKAIALLSDRFAQGELDLEAFEERVTIAHRAKNREELAALTTDLAPPADELAPNPTLCIASETPQSGEAVAIFGGTQRVGKWRVPRRLRVVAVFGGVKIDLREAELPAGVIDMDVRATFGGVQIIVPPTLAVEVHGSAVFGGFAHLDRVPPNPDPNAPMVNIHGTALFGGVSIETRLAGESRDMAFRRNRKAKPAHRHLRRLDK